MAKKTAGTARKTKGLSVHIGLNAVSAKHYEGWSGELTACEFDAHDMAAIAKAAGMKSTVLLTKKATRDGGAWRHPGGRARRSSPATFCFLTYSGPRRSDPRRHRRRRPTSRTRRGASTTAS